MIFSVSVIIPVYNAESFVTKAVESAVSLEEVEEVILIEDGSVDSSLEVCRKLEKEFKKVNLLRHPNGENKGVCASRNLGLNKASCDFIAFLDSDDWYLPNRFKKTKKEFDDSLIDGVYEPIGTFFYHNESFLFGKKINKDEGDKIITFLKTPVKPSELFYSLLSQKNGNFSTDGITLRKSLVRQVGLFSRELQLHEDTEFWIRCAYYGRLKAPVNSETVAIRGVHGNNSNNKVNFNSKALFYNKLFDRFKKEDLSWKERILLYKKNIFFNRQRKYYGVKTWKKYPELLKITLKTIFG